MIRAAPLPMASRELGWEKGDSPHLPRPTFGRCPPGGGHHARMVVAQMGTVPFFRSGIRYLALAAVLAATLLVGIPPTAAEQSGQQVWLVSTHRAPRCGDLERGSARIQYWQLDPSAECQWLPADAETFHATADPAAPTTICVYGNQTDRDVAIEHTWHIYCRMKQAAAGRPSR